MSKFVLSNARVSKGVCLFEYDKLLPPYSATAVTQHRLRLV